MQTGVTDIIWFKQDHIPMEDNHRPNPDDTLLHCVNNLLLKKDFGISYTAVSS